MSALTMASNVRVQEVQPAVGPLAWRRMAWVTWRQHRTALIGTAVLLGGVALFLWFAGLDLHQAYATARGCRPAGSPACGHAYLVFDGKYDFLANGGILQALPVLVGAFLGAPLLAREFESGTVRFAWTQGFGRVRWTIAKVVALAALVTAATGALAALMSWYFRPYFVSAGTSVYYLKDAPFATSPFAVGVFTLRGVAFAGWALLAFSLGAFAGILLRRVVPAIAASMAAYIALAFATGGWLRERYLSPLVTRGTWPNTAWVVQQSWDHNGRPVSQTAIDQVLSRAPASVLGKGGIPQSQQTMHYLNLHGFTQLTSYQPASRYWTFQWIEGGWLLGLSLVLLTATILLARRRSA